MKIDITKNPLTQHSLDNARLSIIELQSRLSVRKRNVLSAGYTIGGMCMSLMVVLGSTGAFSYAYFVNVLMAGVFGILVSVYHVAQICMNLKMTESFYSAFLGVTISMVVGSSLGFLQEPNLAAAGAFFGMTSMLVASLIANLWNKYINEPVTEANDKLFGLHLLLPSKFENECIELDTMRRQDRTISQYINQLASLGRKPVYCEYLAAKSWMKNKDRREEEEKRAGQAREAWENMSKIAQ